MSAFYFFSISANFIIHYFSGELLRLVVLSIGMTEKCVTLYPILAYHTHVM